MNTVYETLVEQFGAENIYMLREDYHGRYQDDDCYFTYINMVDGKTHSDEWSTRFAAPNYSRFVGPTLNEGVKSGKISLRKVLEVLFCRLSEYIPTAHYPRVGASNFEYTAKTIQIPCKVTKGRKFRGEGILVGVRAVESSFGISRYAQIFSDGQLCEAVLNNVEVDDEVLQSYYLIWRAQKINSVNFDEIEAMGVDNAIKFAQEAFHTGVEYFFHEFKNILVDVEGMKSKEEVMRENKRNEFKVRKMEELRAWARTKVEESEVENLAQRVWDKHYAV